MTVVWASGADVGCSAYKWLWRISQRDVEWLILHRDFKGLKIKSVQSLSSVKTIKTSVMQLWISQVQDAEGLSVCVGVQCSFAKYLHFREIEFKHASSLKEEFTQILSPFFDLLTKEWSYTKFDIMGLASPMILRCPMTAEYIFIYFTSMCCRCIILHYQK